MRATICALGGYFKFYLPQARLDVAAMQGAEALVGELDQVFVARRLEEEVGDESFFFLTIKQLIKCLPAGPAVVLGLGEDAVEQAAGEGGGVDPVVRELGSEGDQQAIVVQAQVKQMLLGAARMGVGARAGGGGRRFGRGRLRVACGAGLAGQHGAEVVVRGQVAALTRDFPVYRG